VLTCSVSIVSKDNPPSLSTDLPADPVVPGGAKEDFTMSTEPLKAAAYDEIADLAVTTKTKLLRASETADRDAILNDYFQQSVMVMRQCGMAIRIDSADGSTRLRRVG
jgi:hypothetical protein